MTANDRIHEALIAYARSRTRNNARTVLLQIDWDETPTPDSKAPSKRLVRALVAWRERRSRANAQAVLGTLDWSPLADQESVRRAAELLQYAATWIVSQPLLPAGATDEHTVTARPDGASERLSPQTADHASLSRAEQISGLAQTLVHDLAQARTDWERSEDDSRAKQQEIDRLEQELAGARLIRSQSEDDSRSNAERISLLEAELTRARADREESEDDSRVKRLTITHLEAELHEAQTRYEQSEQDSREKREQIEQLERDLGQVHEMYGQSEQDSREKREQIEQLERDLGQVHEMYGQSEQDSREKREQIEQLERDLERMVAERGESELIATPAEDEFKRHLGEMTSHWQRSEEDSQAKRRQIDQLERNLEEAREAWQRSEQDSQQKQRQIENTEIDLESTLADWQQSEDDSERKREEISRNNLQIAVLNEYVRHLEGQIEALRSQSRHHWSKVLAPPSFALLVTAAQRHLNALVVPGAAVRDLDKLDRQKEHATWVRDAWKALCALQAYAEQGRSRGGNFADWCLKGESEHVWYPDRLALHESDSTMSTHGDKRVFAVDRRVEETGETVMEAHIKVTVQGNENIPRIHFHDDTSGVTKRIHIGFIGPHSLVPTANF